MTGAEYKKGKARTLQMTNLSEGSLARFIKLEKVGYGKFLLQEIYEEPLAVMNKRTLGNSSVYLKYIELIILKYLSDEFDNSEVIFSKRKLWLLLGMINKNYRKIDNEKLLELGKDVITISDINSFYLRCNCKLNRILKTALDNLSRRKLIDYEERTIIHKTLKFRSKCVVATPEEREEIISIEYDVLHKFKCENISQIFVKKLAKSFYECVNREIKTRYNWDYYYKGYSIVFNHENIENTIPTLEKNVEDAIQELNGKIIQALNKEADAIYERQMKKYNEILIESAYHPVALNKFAYLDVPHDRYTLAQRILAEELIDISREDNRMDAYDILDMDQVYKEDGEILDDFDEYISKYVEKNMLDDIDLPF